MRLMTSKWRVYDLILNLEAYVIITSIIFVHMVRSRGSTVVDEDS